jgi:hypothetical protein
MCSGTRWQLRFEDCRRENYAGIVSEFGQNCPSIKKWTSIYTDFAQIWPDEMCDSQGNAVTV